MDLREFNEKTYKKYIKLENIEDLACPNLVSSKKFLDNIRKNPILYIGQETNGWVNGNIVDINIDNIEDAYDNFLINHHTSKTIFWRFLKECIKEDYSNFYKNIVWSNTILIGKRYSKGHPIVNEDIKNLSLKNLLFLYEYFEPSAIINVSGNTNPYYDITNDFLKKIGSKLENKWPNKDNHLLIDDKKILCGLIIHKD